jgi:hypothetical protein
MITIKPTKAGKEYLNDTSDISEKVLLSKCGGNNDKAIAKLMTSSIKLLKKTQNENESVITDSLEELNFLVINKLAQVIDNAVENTNHLSFVHNSEKVVEKVETPMQNAIADAQNEQDEVLGETPEVLPTHLGNIELEKEED